MIKKFKLFMNPVSDLEKWLNKMSNEGCRLIKAGKVFYYFEECKRNKYVYAVDYVANKSYDELREYQGFLEELNIRHMEKPANLGKLSIGNVRWRPYADKGARIATSSGMINRELLILEKENDGKPFNIYTNVEDKINALKTMRKPIIVIMAFIGLMLLTNIVDFIPIHRWSFLEINLLAQRRMPMLIVIGIVEVLLLINFIRFTLAINQLKREADIHE